MARYLAQRIVTTAVVLLLILVLLTLVVSVVPGDPVRTILGSRATPELSAAVRTEMGLDKPVPQRVVDFASGAVQGDLGRDLVTQRPVTELIGAALPHTLLLALASLLLAVGLGLPLGVYAAVRSGGWGDRLLGAGSIIAITAPSYVVGLLLLLAFSVWLDVLPAVGAGELSEPVDYARHLVLPAVALGLAWVGYLARLVRSSMLEVIGADYIRTSYAYGLRERLIFWRYALRNAIIPAVAVLGVCAGYLVAGAVFVENIFSRPGIGTMIVDAMALRNYPIVQGCVLVTAVIFVLANLIADVSYRFLDPRIRFGAQ
jgi:peptide/nickel transport system permease protein